jgi:hypothetical protein
MGKPWENGDLYGKSQFLIGKPSIICDILVIYGKNIGNQFGKWW